MMNKKHFYAAVILFSFLAAGIKPTFATTWIIGPDQESPVIPPVTIGTWNGETRTFTLAGDTPPGDNIQIIDNNLTLNGLAPDGETKHKVNGSGQAGILLDGRTGVTVKNVTVSGFVEGISLRLSNNCIVTNNTVSTCDYGIWLAGSSNNIVTDNEVNSNQEAGIWLQEGYEGPLWVGSDNNTLTGNIVSDHTAGQNTSGIYIQHSTYNTLTNNAVSKNKYGITLWSCNNTSVTGNNISNNDSSASWAIHLFISNTNKLTSNNISKNYGGIWLEGCNDNKIYHNNFIDNTGHAYVEGCTGNVFNLDKPIGGNYWSNWCPPEHPDDDGDGFVDEPYPFNVNSQDNLPWTRQHGWLNQPPVADAGPDQSVECACQTDEGKQVTLDGTGSCDPDGDPLTYQWTGPFVGNPASGATLTVTLNGCLGDYMISLVVNDGELDSDEDTVTITFEDTTPPYVSHPGNVTIEAMGPDGVPVDDDRIQTFLDGASATDNHDPEPTITNDAPAVFPPGDTIVTFTATDASVNSSTCSSTVTVVEAAEANLRIIPKIINREGRLERILAVIRFPEGTAEEDIDIGQPLILYPGDSLNGVEAINQRIVTWYRWGTLRVSLFASFSKDEVTAGVPEDGQVEMMVISRFMDGQYFYGLDTVRIISWDWTRW